MRVRVQGHVAGPADYGTYRLTAEENNHTIGSIEFKLHDISSTVLIGLIPYAIDASYNEITVKGTLKRTAPPDCRLIRLIPLFATIAPYDAPVYKEQFTVMHAKPGKYAAVLLGPSGVCWVSDIHIGLGVTFQTVVVE
jgi:hypothetical protein